MTASKVPESSTAVIDGIDTHGDTKVVASLDERGQLLATATFPTSPGGHTDLEAWLLGFGPIAVVGIEGTGCWGAGNNRALRTAGHRTVEVERPTARSDTAEVRPTPSTLKPPPA